MTDKQIGYGTGFGSGSPLDKEFGHCSGYGYGFGISHGSDKLFGCGYSINSDIDTDVNDDDTTEYYRSKTSGFGKGVFFSDGYWNWCGRSEGMASGQGHKPCNGYGVGTIMACGTADLKGTSETPEFESD